MSLLFCTETCVHGGSIIKISGNIRYQYLLLSSDEGGEAKQALLDPLVLLLKTLQAGPENER